MTESIKNLLSDTNIKIIGAAIFVGGFYVEMQNVKKNQEVILQKIEEMATKESVETVAARVGKKTKILDDHIKDAHQLDIRLSIIEKQQENGN